jgi:hypothetical protein
MFQHLCKLFGNRFKNTKKAPVSHRTPLDLEALGERLVPSSIPNLVGTTLSLGGGRSLQVTSETDNGLGGGNFSGTFVDSAHGISLGVTASILHEAGNDYHIFYYGEQTYGSILSEEVIGYGEYFTATSTRFAHYQGVDSEYFNFSFSDGDRFSYSYSNNDIDAIIFTSVSIDGSGSVGHPA